MKQIASILPRILSAFVALAFAGCQSYKTPAVPLSPEEKAGRLAEAQIRLSELEPQIARLDAASPDRLAEVVAELGLGDAEFESARRKKTEADKALKQIGYSHLPGHPEYREKARLAKLAEEDLAKRANWIRYQRKRETDLVRDTVSRLKTDAFVQ